MTDSTSGIIKLNIGGVRYETSASTLRSSGDNFFTRLLSSSLSSYQDEAGAYFIDRTGEYFAPILHYMRSGILSIPGGMNVKALRGEAEFYLVGEFIAVLQELEEERQRVAEENKKCSIHLVFEGCYVNESRGEALIFYPDDKLTCIKVGEKFRNEFSAYDQAIVVRNHRTTPTIWKEDQTLAGQFAQFYTAMVNRGFYKVEEQALRLCMAKEDAGNQGGMTTWKMASVLDSFTVLVQCDRPPYPFSKFSFREF